MTKICEKKSKKNLFSNSNYNVAFMLCSIANMTSSDTIAIDIMPFDGQPSHNFTKVLSINNRGIVYANVVKTMAYIAAFSFPFSLARAATLRDIATIVIVSVIARTIRAQKAIFVLSYALNP